jgi:hypothetical protein
MGRLSSELEAVAALAGPMPRRTWCVGAFRQHQCRYSISAGVVYAGSCADIPPATTLLGESVTVLHKHARMV